MRKFFLLFSFYAMILSSPSLFSQEKIYPSLPTEPVAIKTIFSMNFEIETADINQFSVNGLTLLPFASLYEYPRVTKSDWNKNLYSIQVRFLAQKSGRYLLEGLSVHTIEKDFIIVPQMLEIGVWEGRKIKVPLEFRWVIDEVSHFEQEAFPVRLELVDHPTKEFLVDKIDFHSNSLKNGATLEKFNTPPSLSERKLAEKTLYSYTVANYIVSFPKAGKQFLPSGIIFGKNRQGNFSALEIPIEPLNEEEKSGENSIQAIGKNFSYQYELTKRESTVGDFFTLVVTLSGCGNLNKMIIPQPYIHGMKMTHLDDRISYNITTSGFQGFQSSQWGISSDTIGEFLLFLPDLHWFNLATEKIEVIPGESIALKVFSQMESENVDRPFLKLIERAEVQKASRNGLIAEGLNYILFLPAVIFFFIGLLLFIRRRKKVLIVSLLVFVWGISLFSKSPFEQKVDDGIILYSQGAYQEAKDSFLSALEENPQNPALHFNVGLCCYRLGESGNAIFHSRKAVSYHPAKKKFRDFARFLEKEYELPYQYSLPLPIQSDWFFVASVVLCNIAGICFIFVGYSKKRRGAKVVFLITLSALLFLSLLFGVSYQIKNRELIVVSQPEKALLALHSKNANPILNTPEGTTLKVIGEYEEYYIAKSNLGFEGWICKDDVINIKR